MGDDQSGAVGADAGARSGRGDQPPLLAAVPAGAPPAQGGRIAGVADGSLGPADGRRPVLPAMGARGRGPRRAGRADRPGAREAAFPASPADRADRRGHPVAVHAHVRAAVAAPDGDRGGLAAGPAGAVTALAAAAPLADRLAAAGPPGDRPDRAAPGAGGRELPAAAPRAGPALPGPGQRPPGAPAGRARRSREHRGPAGDQRGDQATHCRRRTAGEHIGGLASCQRRRQAPQHRAVTGDRVDGRSDLARGQRLVGRCDPGHNSVPAAPGTVAAGFARIELVTGRARPRRAGRHPPVPGSGRTRARRGRAGPGCREPWLCRSVLTPVIGESRIQLLINRRCFVSGSWLRLLGAGPSSEPRLWLSSVACKGRSATGSACGRSTLTRSSRRRIRHLRGRARCGCQPVESELADTGSP